MHSTTDGTFYNACKSCGHEWSPAALTAWLGKEKREKAKLEELARQGGIFNPWRKNLLEELSPFLGDTRAEFSGWLKEKYLGNTTREELDELVKADRRYKHPWVVFQKTQSYGRKSWWFWLLTLIYLIIMFLAFTLLPKTSVADYEDRTMSRQEKREAASSATALSIGIAGYGTVGWLVLILVGKIREISAVEKKARQ